MDRNAAISANLGRELDCARQQCAEAPGDLSRELICEQLAARINELVAPIYGTATFERPWTVQVTYPDGTTRYRIWQ